MQSWTRYLNNAKLWLKLTFDIRKSLSNARNDSWYTLEGCHKSSLELKAVIASNINSTQTELFTFGNIHDCSFHLLVNEFLSLVIHLVWQPSHLFTAWLHIISQLYICDVCVCVCAWLHIISQYFCEGHPSYICTVLGYWDMFPWGDSSS